MQAKSNIYGHGIYQRRRKMGLKMKLCIPKPKRFGP